MSIHNADPTWRQLSEVVPFDLEAPVLAWLAREVERQCVIRDDQLDTMLRLSGNGREIAAYREATEDLRLMAWSWFA